MSPRLLHVVISRCASWMRKIASFSGWCANICLLKRPPQQRGTGCSSSSSVDVPILAVADLGGGALGYGGRSGCTEGGQAGVLC